MEFKNDIDIVNEWKAALRNQSKDFIEDALIEEVIDWYFEDIYRYLLEKKHQKNIPLSTVYDYLARWIMINGGVEKATQDKPELLIEEFLKVKEWMDCPDEYGNYVDPELKIDTFNAAAEELHKRGIVNPTRTQIWKEISHRLN